MTELRTPNTDRADELSILNLLDIKKIGKTSKHTRMLSKYAFNLTAINL